MKLLMAYKVIRNLLPNLKFPDMVIFRRKKTCGISTENYVLCSFELEKDLIFRICAILLDLKENYGLCPSTNKGIKFVKIWNNLIIYFDKLTKA